MAFSSEISSLYKELKKSKVKKAALRKQFLTERQALSAEEAERRSQCIANLFLGFLSTATANYHYLHTFLPILRQHEINTWLIIRRLWADFPQVQVVAPVANFESGTLVNYIITPETQFAETRFGIPEPLLPAIGPQPLAPSKIDLVLVPLLAFDRQGQRVGYGGGFYDRFLAHCQPNCLKIGLSLFEPIDQIDDVFAGDIQLDVCITPMQIWRFEKRNNQAYFEK